MSDNKIFSGDASRTFWDEINGLNNTSTGDEVQGVLYSFGCKLQELEAKIDRILKAQQESEKCDADT